jgi:hypothetical protein
MGTSKKYFIFSLILTMFSIFLLGSCQRGTGCPAEDVHVALNKKGNPKKKSQSGLFDKKMTKKMNKKR